MSLYTFIPVHLPAPLPLRSHTRPHLPRMASPTHPPDFFSPHLYHRVTPLSLTYSAHHIQLNSTDAHLIHHSQILALVDHPTPTTLISHLNHLLDTNSPPHHYQQSVYSLPLLLSKILHHKPTSALLADCSSNIVRLAWTGLCGYILVRGSQIIQRSYDRRQALEHMLHPSHQNQIRTEFLELQDNDLLIMGSDGLFANLKEEQILAFVRPVPDGAEDTTLSIANNTCLGTWTSDDVDFIAYYLAFLAANYAEAEVDYTKPGLGFPFPPSPHVDDVTVMVAACEFNR